MTKQIEIETIHYSLEKGQREQMVKQIQEYGEYDFFSEYAAYIKNLYQSGEYHFKYFTDAVISYFRITSD